MRVLVFGSETPALAIAAVAARASHDVTLSSLTELAALQPVASQGGVHVSGLLPPGFAALAVVADPTTIARQADVIVVATAMAEHPRVHTWLRMVGSRAGVALAPGGVGGSFAFGGLAAAFVAELPGFPVLADYDGWHTLNVRAVKRALPVGVLPHPAGQKAATMLRQLGLHVLLSSSVLETSLANTNVLIHPPLVLANWARVESGDRFSFYREGLTPAGARLIERMDLERQAVATAYGIEPMPLTGLLQRFYGDQGMRGSDIAELLGTFPAFSSTPGPKSPAHRYLTDDVPFGLVPLAALAAAARVSVPLIDGLIDVLGGLCDADFRANGRSLADMGLDGLDRATIAARA